MGNLSSSERGRRIGRGRALRWTTDPRRANAPVVQIDQGAGHWQLDETLPGLPGRAYQARAAGDEIDVHMIQHKDGDLVLIGGHSDWATGGGEVPLQLSIDGAPPVVMKAQTLNNLILTLVTDPSLLKRLRLAKTLDWTIPTGHVHAEVSGLGVALDAMKACRARHSGK